MTIDRTDAMWKYTPNGVTVDFFFNNLVESAAELAVTGSDPAGGVVTLPGHSVVGVGNPAGGHVHFESPPPAPDACKLVTLIRKTDQLQSTPLTGKDFTQRSGASQEFDLNHAMLCIQDLQAQINGCLRIPREVEATMTLPAMPHQTARSNGLLGFDLYGAPKIYPFADGPFMDLWGVAYPDTHTFLRFNNASGTTAAMQHRLSGRVFVGPATVNDGTYWSLGGADRPTGFTDLDWLGLESKKHYNGGDGVGVPNGNDGNWGTLFVLYDDQHAPGPRGGPGAAIVAATKAEYFLTGGSPRVLDLFGCGNVLAGQSVPLWTIYAEIHRLTPGMLNCFGMELGCRNSVGAVTNWNPFQTPGVGTIGINIQAGCGLSATGQFPATCCMYFTKNPMDFGAGLIFLQNVIGPYGIGGTRPAIEMPHDHEVQWFVDGATLAGRLHGDAFGNFFIKPGAGEVVVGGSLAIDNGAAYRFGHVTGAGTGDTYIQGSDSVHDMLFVVGNVQALRIKPAASLRFMPLAAPPPAPETGEAHFEGPIAKWRVWDGARYLEAKRPFTGALVSKNAVQSIPDGVTTTLTWQVAAYNAENIYNAGTPTRLTVPAGVTRVRLTGRVIFDNNPTGGRFVRINKNGGEVAGQSLPSPGFTYVNLTTEVLPVVAGDFFELSAQQFSGGPLNILDQSEGFAMEIVD